MTTSSASLGTAATTDPSAVTGPSAAAALASARCPMPTPRGELGRAVSELLAGDPRTHPHDDVPGRARLDALPRGAELLADEDAMLTWFVLAELSGRGVEGVDDRWDEHPVVAALRASLGDLLEQAVRDRVGPVEACTAEELPARIREELAAVDAPPLSTHLLTAGTLEQYRDLLRHRSAYHLREADPHTSAIPRLGGQPKAALLEIQADEYGGGRVERMHSTLFAEAMDALGLDTRYGAQVEHLPAVTLAWSNAMTLFASRRRLRAAVVGHLVALECTSSVPNRRYADGLRRLGAEDRAAWFFDEHVEADAVHEQVAIHDMAVSLVAAEPDQSVELLTGLRAALELDADLVRHLMDSWGVTTG